MARDELRETNRILRRMNVAASLFISRLLLQLNNSRARAALVLRGRVEAGDVRVMAKQFGDHAA